MEGFRFWRFVGDIIIGLGQVWTIFKFLILVQNQQYLTLSTVGYHFTGKVQLIVNLLSCYHKIQKYNDILTNKL